jgi:hypothetical protein
MRLADKFEKVLQLTGHTRSSFARSAGVSPGIISRLIPRDGRPPERTVDTATILRMISASAGLLTIDDFTKHRAMRGRPFRFENMCPLCGHALEEHEAARPEKNSGVPHRHGEAGL